MSRDEHSHSEWTQQEQQDQSVDEAWLARVRDVYEPEPMTPAQRLAFDARLEERIDRTRRRNLIVSIAGPVLLAAAAALIWIAVAPQAPGPRPATQVATDTQPTRPASLRAWQHEVIAAADPTESTRVGPSSADLPAEYQALDSLFLAGANGGQHGR